jgi:hypothetical protein
VLRIALLGREKQSITTQLEFRENAHATTPSESSFGKWVSLPNRRWAVLVNSGPVALVGHGAAAFISPPCEWSLADPKLARSLQAH